MRYFHRVHSDNLFAIVLILLLTLIAENSEAQPVFSFSDRAESVTLPADTVAAQSPLKSRTGTPPTPRSILLIPDTRIKTTAKADSITPPGTPHKIGYGREVPQLSGTEDTSANLQWQDSQNGGLIAAISIASQQAKGIRIGLLIKRLPAEAIVRFYSQGAENAYEVSGKEILVSIKRNLDAGESGDYANTYWSPQIDGEEATIEIELPLGIGKEAVEIAIPKVSHIYISPIATQEDHIKSLGDAESCEIDVNCYSAWSSESNATAKMSYVAVDGNSYVCSGTLLNDTASSYAPYFLSANHCISKQTEASTLHTYWFYRSTSCNSSVLNSGYKTIYGGATLLYASSSTDTSFMKLNDSPPVGAMYAGWDASTPVVGTSVVDIHHPSGDLQKISFGSVSSFMDCTTLDPITDTFTCSNATSSSGEFITVTLSNGITEGGSSGSGIFKTVGSGHYLIGQLYGGTSSCYSTSGTDRFGRFDLAYNAALYQWLKPGSIYALSVSKSGNGNGTVTSSPTGITCGTTCSALFDSGSSVILTAVSSPGSTFSGWSGSCSGASSSCTVFMGAANSVIATFAAPVISLGEALDNTALVWTTGGNVPFTTQTATSFYGGSAAQTGKIGNSQSTYLSTNVTGPGTLSFYWKVSSEQNYDFFRVYLDGVSTYKWSGNTSWANNTLSIPSGTHTVKWEYTKDSIYSSGLDAGWVDLVVFVPIVTNGTCGSSNGGTFLAAPTYNLCTTGTASTVTGSGPWYWTCAGLNGGTDASCTVSIGTPPALIPQTGQTACYSEAGTAITCSGTGQDGELQTGVAWPNPRFVDNGDQTVTDNLTGLIWSKDANPAAGTKTWQQALDYIKTLNIQNYQGHNDWRLPNINELASMVNKGQGNQATWLNSQGFFNVQSDGYRSSSTPPFGSLAWVVYMDDGFVVYDGKTYSGYYVWPVRAGQSGSFGYLTLPKTGQTACYNESGATISCSGTGQDGELQIGAAWPSPRFAANADQSVIDNLTGLIWNKDANLTTGTKTWQQALDYIKTLNNQNYQGHIDWRLPNINELQSLINKQSSPSTWLNSQGFTNVQSDRYWSSSTHAYNATRAWFVYMSNGPVSNLNKINSYYVWPVRGGQSYLTLSVTKSATGSGTVTSSTGGINCGSTCSANISSGTSVTLTASPVNGSTFTGWSGACSGTGACTVTMDSAKSVTASFTLSSPTIQTTKAKVFLGADDNFTVSNNGTILYGNIGNNEVTIASGVTGVVLDQNIERIILADAASNYTFRQTGNIINVYDATGTKLIVKVPVQGDSNGTQLSFSNGTDSAEVKLTRGIMTLGGETVSTSSAMTLNPLTTASTPSTATSTKAKVYLGTDDIFTVSNSGTTVYGSSGKDIVTIAAGITNVTLDQNIERINFSGASNSYAFKQTGNLINVYDASNITLLLAKAPVQGDTDGTILSFSDGIAEAHLSGGVMTLAGTIVNAGAATPLTLVGIAAADVGL